MRWYLRCKLSSRDIEERIAERGIHVDHSTVNRWDVKYTPLLAVQAQHYKRSVGDTVDFLLTGKRETKAALRPYAKRFATMALR